jgi:predicted ABC-type ATPase
MRRLSLGVERLHMSLSPAEAASSEGKMLTKRMSVQARAQAVARILRELDRELAFFKQESRRDARHVLRSVVDAKDVGYLIALLKAMYDDDAFENWIFGAQYGAGSK